MRKRKIRGNQIALTRKRKKKLHSLEKVKKKIAFTTKIKEKGKKITSQEKEEEIEKEIAITCTIAYTRKRKGKLRATEN